MPSNGIKTITSLALALALALQPIQYSFAKPIDHLATEQVSAKSHMMPDTDGFARSVVSDVQFFAFALYTYRSVVLEACDMERLTEGLKALPYWKDFSYRSSLASDFVSVAGDILTIRFRDGGAVRVFPLAAHTISSDGAISDGIVPRYHTVTDEHVIQYIAASSMSAGSAGLNADKVVLSRPLESQPDSVPYEDAGQAMIGFGPALNHTSLDISPEYKGIYITTVRAKVVIGGEDVERLHLVCKADDGSPEGAGKMAEMINQVLSVVFNQHFGNPEKRSTNKYTPYVTDLIEDMKSRTLGKRLDVEIASNLNANSARYYGKIVFNMEFIETLYHNWFLNRVQANKDNWELEMGALWMVAERLFHEIGHDPDEAEQIYKDHLFFKAGISNTGFFRKAVRRDSTGRIERKGSQKSAVFGKFFGSDDYFAMIHGLAKLPDDDKERKIKMIREYLARTYRDNSLKDSLKIGEEKEALAAAILSVQGITDDIFGESILGSPLKEFLRAHCLFDNAPPYDDPEVTKARKLWSSNVFSLPVNEIKATILNVARGVGEEKDIANWIDRRLGPGDTSEGISVRMKLFPIIRWASGVVNPQNYQRRDGRLFGSIYYEGLNLLTIPIFPLDKNGEIDWKLFKWAYAPDSAPRSDRGPPAAYFNAKKTSLYEYVIGHEVPRLHPAPRYNEQAPGAVTSFEGLTNFDRDGEQQAIAAAGSCDAAQAASEIIEEIHNIVMNIDMSSTVGKVTYILIDKDIPAPSQQAIVELLNRHSRERLVAEKVLVMDPGAIENYMADNNCTKENTVVILSDTSRIGPTRAGVNMLVARKTGVTDFVNIEALVGAGRSMLSRDWDSFKAIYQALTGDECPDIQEAWLQDPSEFARRIIIVLPSVSVISSQELKDLNDTLRLALVAA